MQIPPFKHGHSWGADDEVDVVDIVREGMPEDVDVDEVVVILSAVVD